MPNTLAYPQDSTYVAEFGTIGWDDVGEVTGVPDAGYALSQDNVTDNDYTFFVVGTTFDFSEIPDNATITGLRPFYFLPDDDIPIIATLQLYYDGEMIGNLYTMNDIGAQGGNGMNAIAVTPGVGFRFGLTAAQLTPALVKSAEFGLGCAFGGTSNPGEPARISGFRLQVYWEPRTGGFRSRARALGRGR